MENTQHIFSFLLGSFSVFQCRGVGGGQPPLTMACDGVHLPQWEDFSWEVVVTSHEKIWRWEVFSHGRWWWAGWASGSRSMIAERTCNQFNQMQPIIFNSFQSDVNNDWQWCYLYQSGPKAYLFPALTPDFVGSNSFPVMFQGLFGSISFPRAVPCLMKDSCLGWADWLKDGWL